MESGTEQEIFIDHEGNPVAGKRIGLAKKDFSTPDDIDPDNPAIAKLFTL